MSRLLWQQAIISVVAGQLPVAIALAIEFEETGFQKHLFGFLDFFISILQNCQSRLIQMIPMIIAVSVDGIALLRDDIRRYHKNRDSLHVDQREEKNLLAEMDDEGMKVLSLPIDGTKELCDGEDDLGCEIG
jgi:hypothetical protein